MNDSKSNSELSPLVETAWLAEHLGDPDLRIFDCSVVMEMTDGEYKFVSGRKEWEKGHIPGSDFIDVMGELRDPENHLPMMMPPVELFAQKMGAHGVGTGTKVVLYDRTNHAWAARVWWMLRVAGFTNAAVLNGGWTKWLAEDQEISMEPAVYPRATFVPKHRPELFADKQEVLDSLHKGEICIINSLSPEEFSGKTSRFARPGRIPGSENVFCQTLVDPKSGAFLPLDALKEKFTGTNAANADRVITYCGAGIAASSDAFVLTLLGMKNVAVYDGSLSEWAADPSLPMETDSE